MDPAVEGIRVQIHGVHNQAWGFLLHVGYEGDGL